MKNKSGENEAETKMNPVKLMNVNHRNNKVALLGFVMTLLLLVPVARAASIDHSYTAWEELLKNYTQNGFVDYEALKRSPQSLAAVLESFQATTQSQYDGWTRNQKIAFWLNAYNLAAMNLVVEHYPIRKKLGWKALAYPDNSIQQIPDVWDRKSIHVLGKDRSLNEIEHQILRKEFKEPRIHFALVCASLGCPKLRSKSYDADRLDEQLDDQVLTFMSDTEKARYHRENDTLYLSPILKWFADDFGSSGGQVAFVKKYFPEENAAYLSDKTRLKWLDYDWSLNEKGSKS